MKFAYVADGSHEARIESCRKKTELEEFSNPRKTGVNAITIVEGDELLVARLTNGKSEIIGTSGLVKIVRRKDGPVLGVHLVGDRVGELITEGQLAVGWEAHPEDIAPFIHAHPTQSEALGEAFLALAGKPLHAL